MRSRSRGAALVMTLLLLALLTMFALAAAHSARLEHALASNEQFRENAANAARAGIELATLELLSMPDPDRAVMLQRRMTLAGGVDTVDVDARFAGYEANLPQESAELLVGAHFEITSTGRSARGAVDTQREGLMIVVPAPADFSRSIATLPGGGAAPCGPLAAERPCVQAGQMHSMFRRRLPESGVR
jgi:hypothetical protein